MSIELETDMRTILLFLVPFVGFHAEVHAQANQSGPVSVYADLYQGKPTASGALYERGALTAAHATLPFGTRVRVANFETGRMADVLVNDRKHEDGRLVTISRAAADAIGLAPNKTAPGSIYVLASPAPVGATAPAPTQSPTQIPTQRKFSPLAGLFGKENAAAPVAQAPLQYGIPGNSYAPPAAPQGGGLFQKSGKIGGLFAAKPAMPAPNYNYPSPFSAPQTYASNPPAELMAMNAPVAKTAVPGPVLNPQSVQASPVPPAAALPPASPSAPYRVQFGAYRHVSSADELSRMLDGAGISSSIFTAPGTGLNVVVTDAGFRTADEAQRWIDYEGARRKWTDRPVVIR